MALIEMRMWLTLNLNFLNLEEGAMATLERPGVPVGGFTSVGQIHATNNLVLRRSQNAMGVAVELLASHTPGAPVIDDSGEFIGFVSEFDVLREKRRRT